MKSSPGGRSWIAAGVRHELLTRALPALRHDMSAPVSVMRMGLLMLKRQVAAPIIDVEACQERVALIDSQIAELVAAVRSLRDWELATGDDGISRAALVRQCTSLMRAAFDLQNIRLEVDETLIAEDGEDADERWPSGASLRYLLLGAMGFLQDSAPDVATIQITPDGNQGIQLTAIAGATDDADAMAEHRAPRKLAIDVIALQSLADDLGYTLSADRNSVRFGLAAG
ncbi:MAG: hypothetical protein V4636_08350 [Pseudomonadota bacterium]